MAETREHFIHNKKSLEALKALLKKYPLTKTQIFRAGIIALHENEELLSREMLLKA